MHCFPFEVDLAFLGDLGGFLHRNLRGSRHVRRLLSEKTAIKDVIEACGVPHPEVDLICIADDQEPSGSRTVDFSWQVRSAARIEVYPAPAPDDVLPAATRLQTRSASRFIADGHLGKLTRHLRLLGVDAAYERDADDRRLLDIMAAEDRALLTRDRRLLMHSIVRTGYCPRSPDAEQQVREVLSRFSGIIEAGLLAPFSRCLRCNGRLDPAPKESVRAPLSAEPMTLRFYDTFRRCGGCGQIYWAGTHFAKLAGRVRRLMPETSLRHSARRHSATWPE